LIKIIVPDDGLPGGAWWQHQQGTAGRQNGRASQIMEGSLNFHVIAWFSGILLWRN
jgi:hypothetical protein